MKPDVRPPRVVIDTDLVLSALVFAQGRLTRLRQAWQADCMQPLGSRETAAELIRTLGYPKFRLMPGQQRELLADYLPYCITVCISDPAPQVPACRDILDLPFLRLAVAGRADALVTGDQDLLSLGDSFSCPIVTAEQFLMQLALT